MWVNRTLCDVLTEMRECSKTKNFSYLDSLIEEAQSMGNRMESKLSDVRDIKNLHEEIKKLKKKKDKLEKKKKKTNLGL